MIVLKTHRCKWLNVFTSINAIGDFFFYTKVGIGHDLFMRRGKITTPPPPPPDPSHFSICNIGRGFPTKDNRTSGMSNRISLCSSQQNRTSLCSRSNLIVLDLRWLDQIIQRWDRFSLDINFPEEQQRLPFILQSSRTIICPVWTIYWKKNPGKEGRTNLWIKLSVYTLNGINH